MILFDYVKVSAFFMPKSQGPARIEVKDSDMTKAVFITMDHLCVALYMDSSILKLGQWA